MPTSRDRIALGPPAARGWLVDAVRAGGATLVDPAEASGLVWGDADDASGLGTVLDDHRELRWVQLPWAGVEPYVDVIRAHADRVWACGKGVYAEPVAEHALALSLAGMRNLVAYGRADRWGSPAGVNLLGARVVVLGGGGITESLLRLLRPFGARVTVVRRHPTPMPGADDVVGVDRLDDVLH